MKSPYAFNPDNLEAMYYRPWEMAAPAFCVFGNLYFVGNADGASWLVDSGDGLILFDSNYPTADALLIHSIHSLGFDPRDIRAIFHTHGHFDHIGATDLIKALSGAKTYLGRADWEMWKNNPRLAMLEESECPGLSLFVPDVIVNDEDVFTIGNTTIKAVSTPGHTPGSTSYFFDVTDGCVTKRAGLHGGAGLNTLCKEYITEFGVNWREDYVASIHKVMNEPVDIFLGNHTNQNQALQKYADMLQDLPNEFVDPSSWKLFLQDVENRYLNMIRYESSKID